MEKCILCVDGNSIINRAFYGVGPLMNHSGMQTNAVYGMINIINKYLNSLNPDYFVICFDAYAKTFRHLKYGEYKAGRHATPPELISQFEPAKLCLEALGGNCIEKVGFEADDLLGTYAKMANDNGIKAYVLTGDRDSLQLINDNTTVILAKTGQDVIFDRKEFANLYTVNPEQFVDVKALMGDSSDNIPGVLGIGEKTAIKLIDTFSSLDGLYNNYENSLELSAKTKEKLKEGKDCAYLSYELAKIVCDVSDIPSLEEMKRKEIDKARLKSLFKGLDFFKLIKTFGLDDVKVDTNNIDQKENHDGDLVKQESEESGLDNNQNSLKSYKLILGTKNDICENDYAISIDIENDYVCYAKNEIVIKIQSIESQREILNDDKYDFSIFDIKSECHKVDKCGISLECVEDDVKLMGYVCDSNKNVSTINKIVQRTYGEEIESKEDEAYYTYKLKKYFKTELENSSQYDLYKQVEFPLSRVLYDMEIVGIKVNKTELKKLSNSLGETQKELEMRIYLQAGKEFNINSTKQLGAVLFEDLHLPQGKKNKTGYSTDAETLEEIRDLNPIIDDILDYRMNAKLKATYADGLLEQTDENDRVHTSFKQALTATGRLSSADPNLQNIPVRAEIGKEFRKCFVPKDDDHVLIDADYSQIELRVLASIANDTNMIEAFIENEDIHTSTAMRVFNVPRSEVTADMRKKAKVINFGILYGMSSFTLAKDLHTSRRIADEYIQGYLDSYPEIDKYLDDTVNKAKADKFVTTILGRRRYIPELSSRKFSEKMMGERIAKNSPIQGSAADIIKVAMINVSKKLKEAKIDARLVLQVHDELILECHKNCKDQAMEILQNEMENSIKLKVPLIVEIKSGNNWLEAH